MRWARAIGNYVNCNGDTNAALRNDKMAFNVGCLAAKKVAGGAQRGDGKRRVQNTDVNMGTREWFWRFDGRSAERIACDSVLCD